MTVDGTPLAEFLGARIALATQRPSGPWTEVGIRVAKCLTALLDAAIEILIPDTPGVTVVAVGGYGRSEMCLESDVDLMILHDGRVTDETVQALLYPLWDARLKVGHSVRTPREVMVAARENIETLTSLLGARVVGGSVELWEETENLFAGLLRRERDRVVAGLKGNERERRQAEPFRLLATDTKAGRGGLRSLHSLGWERAVRSDLGAVIPEGSDEEQNDRRVLLAVRNALHATAGKPIDGYVFDLRPGVARWLGEAEDEIGRNLYETVRSVENRVDDRWPDLMEEVTDPVRSAGRWLVRSLRRSHVAADDVGGMAIIDAVLDRPPGRLFDGAEELKLRRSASPKWTENDRSTLVRMVAADQRGRQVADRLTHFGWMERVLPELAATHAMPQNAPFHEHTVDDHQWRTVSELLAVTGADSSEPWCRDLAEELGSLDELLIASLFHDVGKGRGGDHSVIGAQLVGGFAERAGFGATAAEAMSDVVRWHLLLPQVATRRDIGNPTVVTEVAKKIGDPQLVRMLALLAVADSRATGRTVWSPWKATLVRSLTAQLLGTFAGSPPVAVRLEEVLEIADGEFDRSEIEHHVTLMDSGYSDRFDPSEILRHLRLFSPRPAKGEAAVDAEHEGDLTSLIVAAADRPGLLVDVSGVLALHGIEVLDARLTVSRDSLALDTFYVTNARRAGRVSAHTVDLVRRDLGKVLAGELDLEAALSQRRHSSKAPIDESFLPTVRFRTDPSTGEEMVEVRAVDRPGFLHGVAAILFDEGLDVRLAKLDTKGGGVTDVFYLRSGVRDRPRLEQRLLTELSPDS